MLDAERTRDAGEESGTVTAMGWERDTSPGESGVLPGFFRWAVWGFAASLLMTAAWSMANPIDGAPDESAHAATAYATAHGDIGDTNPTVPAVYADLADRDLLFCPHRSLDTSADCQNWSASEAKPPRAIFTQFGTYNPVYYALVGWPTLVLKPHAALYGMRLASAFLFSMLFGAALGAAAIGYHGRFATAAPVLALSPMAIFLGGAINPNAIEIVGGLLAWVSLTVLLGRRLNPTESRLVVSLASLSLIALVLTRLLSPLWVVVIVTTVAAATRGWRQLWSMITRSRRFQAHLTAVVVFGLIAVWWSLEHPPVFVGGVNHKADSLQQVLHIAVHQVFWQFPSNTLVQTFGLIGWVEFAVPAVVPVMTIAWGTILVTGLAVPGPRSGRLSMMGLLAFWIIFPSFLAAYMWSGVGWQGRYALPVAIGLPILGLHIIAQQSDRHGISESVVARLTRILTVAVITCNLFVFAVNYPRYSAGWDDRWLLSGYDWQPPLGIAPWGTAFVAGAAILAGLTWRFTRGQRQNHDPRPHRADPSGSAAGSA